MSNHLMYQNLGMKNHFDYSSSSRKKILFGRLYNEILHVMRFISIEILLFLLSSAVLFDVAVFIFSNGHFSTSFLSEGQNSYQEEFNITNKLNDFVTFTANF